MRNTTTYSRGDVVLVNFVFTEETGARRRPAVLVSSEAYHRGRQEAIIAAVTSNTSRILIGDYLLADWQRAGLIHPSVVTGIVRTIKRVMIGRRLGRLTALDMEMVERELRGALGLVERSDAATTIRRI